MNASGNLTGTKPFLKWAGGKTQLVPSIQAALPKDLATTRDLTYVEPFVGGGAILFWLLTTYPNICRAVINDLNPHLCQAYRTLQRQPKALIQALRRIQQTYHALAQESDRRCYFEAMRTEYNEQTGTPLRHTVLLIFLNKTCFNGLYRVNRQGKFNVPHGRYHNPRICDPATIQANSALLQRVTILNGDFSQTLAQVKGKSFFYLDPPYKPLSPTAQFNTYASEVFNDRSQERLAEFCQLLNREGHWWLLSNADVRNTDADNAYFDDLYEGFTIRRICARRTINCQSAKRGAISELLISNYAEPMGVSAADTSSVLKSDGSRCHPRHSE